MKIKDPSLLYKVFLHDKNKSIPVHHSYAQILIRYQHLWFVFLLETKLFLYITRTRGSGWDTGSCIFERVDFCGDHRQRLGSCDLTCPLYSTGLSPA